MPEQVDDLKRKIVSLEEQIHKIKISTGRYLSDTSKKFSAREEDLKKRIQTLDKEKSLLAAKAAIEEARAKREARFKREELTQWENRLAGQEETLHTEKNLIEKTLAKKEDEIRTLHIRQLEIESNLTAAFNRKLEEKEKKIAQLDEETKFVKKSSAEEAGRRLDTWESHKKELLDRERELILLHDSEKARWIEEKESSEKEQFELKTLLETARRNIQELRDKFSEEMRLKEEDFLRFKSAWIQEKKHAENELRIRDLEIADIKEGHILQLSRLEENRSLLSKETEKIKKIHLDEITQMRQTLLELEKKNAELQETWKNEKELILEKELIREKSLNNEILALKNLAEENGLNYEAEKNAREKLAVKTAAEIRELTDHLRKKEKDETESRISSQEAEKQFSEKFSRAGLLHHQAIDAKERIIADMGQKIRDLDRTLQQTENIHQEEKAKLSLKLELQAEENRAGAERLAEETARSSRLALELEKENTLFRSQLSRNKEDTARLIDSHEKEINELQRELQTQKNDQQQLIDRKNEEIIRMNQQIAQLHLQSDLSKEQKAEDLKRLKEEYETNLENAAADWTAEKKKILSELEKTHEEKLSQTAFFQLKEQELLESFKNQESQHRAAREEKEKLLEEKERFWQAEADKWRFDIKQKEENLIKIREDQKKEMLNLKQNLSSREQEWETQKEYLTEQTAHLKNIMDESKIEKESLEKSLKKRTADLEALVLKYQEEKEKLSKDQALLEMKLKEQEAHHDQMLLTKEEEMLRLQSEKEQQISLLHTTLDEKETLIQNLESKLETLTSSRSEEASLYQEKSALLREEIHSRDKEIEILSRNYESKLARQLKNHEVAYARLEEETSSLKSLLENEKENGQSALKGKNHEVQILEKEFKEKLLLIHRDHEKEIRKDEELKEALHKELKNLAGQMEQERMNFEERLAEKSAEKENLLKEKNAQLAQIEKLFTRKERDWESESETLQNKTEDLTLKLETREVYWQEIAKNVDEESSRLRLSFAEWEGKWAKETAIFQADLKEKEKKYRELEKRHRDILLQLQDEKAKAEKSLRESDLLWAGRAAETERKYQQEIKELQGKVSDLIRSEHELQRGNELKLKIEQDRQEASRRETGLNIETLKRDYETRI
ncbi:MAG TPA: hypothetical protein VJC03_01120, partial [bacterium]|nr:hypothetical protein [bacterium]